MIYIKKGKEPASLTKYKKQKFAYYDGYKEKDDLRKMLLKEQGYLCAYCMRRIDIEHMKIEHWFPENELSDIERLDYRNMLGSCEGHIDGTNGKKDDTCDSHKSGDKITVNPLDRSTLCSIKYNSDGEIYSDNEIIEKDIDVVLNLNSEKHLLKLNRKSMLKQVREELCKMQKRGIWGRTTGTSVCVSIRLCRRSALRHPTWWSHVIACVYGLCICIFGGLFRNKLYCTYDKSRR